MAVGIGSGIAAENQRTAGGQGDVTSVGIVLEFSTCRNVGLSIYRNIDFPMYRNIDFPMCRNIELSMYIERVLPSMPNILRGISMPVFVC